MCVYMWLLHRYGYYQGGQRDNWRETESICSQPKGNTHKPWFSVSSSSNCMAVYIPHFFCLFKSICTLRGTVVPPQHSWTRVTRQYQTCNKAQYIGHGKCAFIHPAHQMITVRSSKWAQWRTLHRNIPVWCEKMHFSHKRSPDFSLLN